MIDKKIKELEKQLKITFKNKELLKEALTHRSYAYLTGKQSNERLEFLGDSILNLIVSTYLYDKHSNENEGVLTQLKSNIVNSKALFSFARKLNLGKYIFLGKEEESKGARTLPSILANTFEAVIGALYKDQGLERTKIFVVSLIKKSKISVKPNAKSLLQELVQKHYRSLPEYSIVKEAGPDHCKSFTVTVKINKKVFGIGEGKSKKEAEINAADKALMKIKRLI